MDRNLYLRLYARQCGILCAIQRFRPAATRRYGIPLGNQQLIYILEEKRYLPNPPADGRDALFMRSFSNANIIDKHYNRGYIVEQWVQSAGTSAETCHSPSIHRTPKRDRPHWERNILERNPLLRLSTGKSVLLYTIQRFRPSTPRRHEVSINTLSIK